MDWQDVRAHYPDRWLLVEALVAHNDAERRVLDDIAVIDSFDDSHAAMARYADLHRVAPGRELYVVHSSRESIDITERRWLGVRARR